MNSDNRRGLSECCRKQIEYYPDRSQGYLCQCHEGYLKNENVDQALDCVKIAESKKHEGKASCDLSSFKYQMLIMKGDYAEAEAVLKTGFAGCHKISGHYSERIKEGKCAIDFGRAAQLVHKDKHDEAKIHIRKALNTCKDYPKQLFIIKEHLMPAHGPRDKTGDKASIDSFDLLGISFQEIYSEKLKWPPKAKAFKLFERKIRKADRKTYKNPEQAKILNFCAVIGSKFLKIFLERSETSPTYFIIEKEDYKNSKEFKKECLSNPYFSRIDAYFELKPEDIYPVSKKYPQIELGISTPQDIRRIFGEPTELKLPPFEVSDGRTGLHYYVKRDLNKERDCGSGFSYGIGISFIFDAQQKLVKIAMYNDIEGVC